MLSATLFDLLVPMQLIDLRLPLPLRALLRSRSTALSGWTLERVFQKTQRALKALIVPRYLVAPARSDERIKVPLDVTLVTFNSKRWLALARWFCFLVCTIRLVAIVTRYFAQPSSTGGIIGSLAKRIYA